jgi:hypothetical protein
MFDGRSKKSSAAWRPTRLCAYRKRRSPNRNSYKLSRLNGLLAPQISRYCAPTGSGKNSAQEARLADAGFADSLAAIVQWALSGSLGSRVTDGRGLGVWEFRERLPGLLPLHPPAWSVARQLPAPQHDGSRRYPPGHAGESRGLGRAGVGFVADGEFTGDGHWLSPGSSAALPGCIPVNEGLVCHLAHRAEVL